MRAERNSQVGKQQRSREPSSAMRTKLFLLLMQVCQPWGNLPDLMHP